MNEIQDVVTVDYCSASITVDLKRSTAEASFIVDKWWINRVIVNPENKRDTGIGTKLLTRLKELIKRNGGKLIVVSPGGYGMNLESQIRFYEKNGFIESSHDKGLWEIEV